MRIELFEAGGLRVHARFLVEARVIAQSRLIGSALIPLDWRDGGRSGGTNREGVRRRRSGRAHDRQSRRARCWRFNQEAAA